MSSYFSFSLSPLGRADAARRLRKVTVRVPSFARQVDMRFDECDDHARERVVYVVHLSTFSPL
jgi:hypothetical protein